MFVSNPIKQLLCNSLLSDMFSPDIITPINLYVPPDVHPPPLPSCVYHTLIDQSGIISSRLWRMRVSFDASDSRGSTAGGRVSGVYIYR